MVRFSYIHFILLGFIYVCISCKKKDAIFPIQTIKPVALVYMIADNNLSYFAVQDINEMEAGLPSQYEGQLYVFVDKGNNATPSHPYLLKIKSDNSDKIVSTIIKVYPEINTADASVLKNVLEDIQSYISSQSMKLEHLFLWSHGNAWLPNGYSLYSDSLIKGSIIQSKSFGLDEYYGTNTSPKRMEMDIQDLASVLQSQGLKMVAFDACFMGSVEVAYSLRKCCEKLIFSSAEISSTGFPYQDIFAHFFDNEEPALFVAQAFANYYQHQQGDFLSYAISVIQTPYLDSLAIFTAQCYLQPIYHITDIDIQQLQQYDRLESNYFFDMKSVYNLFLQKNMSFKNRFYQLWAKTVLYESHSPKILGTLELKNVNGLSIYIPQNVANKNSLNQFYTSLPWYEDTDKNNFWNLHF